MLGLMAAIAIAIVLDLLIMFPLMAVTYVPLWLAMVIGAFCGLAGVGLAEMLGMSD